MQNQPPLSESLPSTGWSEWFRQVFSALSGWKATSTKTLTYAFGSIAAQSQASTTLTVKGARSGAAVIVTPSVDSPGIVYTGIVTANDTASIYAKNITAAAVTPANTTFRVIVFQN